MGELAAERVAGEWRRKMEAAEEEWGGKLRESEERAAMALAQAKADMHEELERRDALVASLTSQLRTAETGREEEERLRKSLEEEKDSLLSQLSKAKTDAIRLIKVTSLLSDPTCTV